MSAPPPDPYPYGQALHNWEYVAVLDFESNCVPSPGRNPEWKDRMHEFPTEADGFVMEVVELPTVLLAKSNGCWVVLGEFQRFVKPERFPVTPFCTDLCGITQEDVEKPGEGFVSAWLAWQTWLRGTLEEFEQANASQHTEGASTEACGREHVDVLQRTLLVTCGDWDLRSMLPKQLKLVKQSADDGGEGSFSRKAELHKLWMPRAWCNIKICFENWYGRKGGGMAPMLANLGIDDCRNIGKICMRMFEDAEAGVQEAVAVKGGWKPKALAAELVQKAGKRGSRWRKTQNSSDAGDDSQEVATVQAEVTALERSALFPTTKAPTGKV